MSKKQGRWQETLVHCKTNTPTQKKGGKDPAAFTVPVSSGGKRAGSSAFKPSVMCGRSNSLNSRSGDLTSSASKVGGSLKRGSLVQPTRPASHPARPALRLCSSRSFSSLHTSSFTAVPFMRSSRSLNRLDQRSTGDGHAGSQLKKGQTTEKKVLDSDELSSSQQQIRNNQCHGDTAKKMKTRSPSESTSLGSTTANYHNGKKEIKRSVPDVSCPSLPCYHQLQSLKCRNAEASVIPDVLSFNKGWMMLQDAYGQWQKHWFVLTDPILRFYKDSVAEETADVGGEINLSTCFDITDYPPQKNCGFQVHTKEGVYTFCTMTSGMKQNWVHAVLKNVRPSFTTDPTSSFSEMSQQLSEQQDTESVGVESKAENPNSTLQEHKISEWAEDSHQQEDGEERKLHLEREQSFADGSSASSGPTVSVPTSSARSPISPPQQVEEGECASCQQCPLLVATPQTDIIGASSCLERSESENSTASTALQDKANDQQVSVNATKDKTTQPCEQQAGQLVRELEKTQKELSRLQQLNRNLQDELRQEREIHSRERNDLLLNSSSSSEQVVALQRLLQTNHDLRIELEAQKKGQEEAREAELRRRVDLLAQQAQLLVTGDATALAQAHLEQDRHWFNEQQVEWERSMASLKSQLSVGEEQRREAESRLTQLQQEMQGYHNLQQEAEHLQKHLQDMTAQLRSYKDAQAQKEIRLQKHLMLLQASQDRERRSLAASLAHAERHSQDLQEKLARAEQQVESMNKTHTLTQEIEEVQQQLQEELAHTVSAVQKLQEERERLHRRCEELQNQLSEADGEVTRLQSRLKTEETHYYNLEHSYERVCEELQLALGKVQQRESETQDIREGYEKLLDRKELELSEVLLKMQVLGNSLEETEVKLNEVLKVCTCASSQLKGEVSELANPGERRRQTTGPLVVNDIDPMSTHSDRMSDSFNATDILINSNNGQARARSRSLDPSYQLIATAGDDHERFATVIQLLETKLYVTEEKLRDITQRLEDNQSHISCQDPHLCSQLTQSRATSQHLSLLLHNQAKKSQRFALETEGCCRMLVGRFQFALNIIQACRERLQGAEIMTSDIEKQLATAAACLQQGGNDAEKLQHETLNVSKGGSKILNDKTFAGPVSNTSTKCACSNTLSGDDRESVGKCLLRELFVVEKMVSVLQGQHGIGQLAMVGGEDEGDVANSYKSIISQRIALKTEKKTLESAVVMVCAEAELIYVAMKLQQKNYGVTSQQLEHQRESLVDISPPELAPYGEQVQDKSRGLEEAAKTTEKDQSDDNEVESEKGPEWLQRLRIQLQRRAKFLHQLCQEISDDECSLDHSGEDVSAEDLNWVQEHAKLIYLSERLYSDLEQTLQRSGALRNKLQDLEKEQDTTSVEEQEALNRTLCEFQEDNSMLREELERAEQRIISVASGNKRLMIDIQKIEDHHEEQMQKLVTEFQDKIKELQHIHEEEMKHLHGYYTKSKEQQTKSRAEGTLLSESNISTSEDTRMEGITKEERESLMVESDTAQAKEVYQKDLGKPQTYCNQDLTAMEEMHKKLIDDLQQQHQTEVAVLLREKDQLLQEETAATMAAIVAMRRAHKQELERYRQTQHIRESADITQLHTQHEKEIQLLHKELESLSVQHTQKCLETSQLSQELQGERKLLMQYQQENEELKQKQSETDEMSHIDGSLNGEESHRPSYLNDFYEMEVILRAREAEMQFLRQEAQSLKEELKIARMDKIYAQNKLKALYNSREESNHDVSKPSEDLKFATWSPSRDASGQRLKDTAANTSNGVFAKKKEKSSLMCRIRGVRSKSLKEGLSIQERMKLFDPC